MSALDGGKILRPLRTFPAQSIAFFLKQPVSSKKLFSRELFFFPPPHTKKNRTSCRFLWKFVSCEKTSLQCWSWSRDFAAEPWELFRKKNGGLRSGSAGSPGVGERSGTERSNERERRADIATARGARARFLPAAGIFCHRGAFLCSEEMLCFVCVIRFLAARKEDFFHAAYDFGDALFF